MKSILTHAAVAVVSGIAAWIWSANSSHSLNSLEHALLSGAPNDRKRSAEILLLREDGKVMMRDLLIVTPDNSHNKTARSVALSEIEDHVQWFIPQIGAGAVQQFDNDFRIECLDVIDVIHAFHIDVLYIYICGTIHLEGDAKIRGRKIEMLARVIGRDHMAIHKQIADEGVGAVQESIRKELLMMKRQR